LAGTTLIEIPIHFIQSPVLPSVLSLSYTCLSCYDSRTLESVLQFLKDIFLTSSFSERIQSIPQTIVDPLCDMLKEKGCELMAKLFEGLVLTFPRDVVPYVGPLLVAMVKSMSNETKAWLETVLGGLSEDEMGKQEKETFLRKLWAYVYHIFSLSIFSFSLSFSFSFSLAISSHSIW